MSRDHFRRSDQQLGALRIERLLTRPAFRTDQCCRGAELR